MKFKAEFEIENCEHCPCLRNFGGERYSCFFNIDREINSWELDEVNKYCPIVKEVVR